MGAEQNDPGIQTLWLQLPRVNGGREPTPLYRKDAEQSFPDGQEERTL